MSSHFMPGVDPTLPRSTPVAPIPLPAGTPEGSCFFPTRAAFHRSHTSTSRCVPTMADQASKIRPQSMAVSRPWIPPRRQASGVASVWHAMPAGCASQGMPCRVRKDDGLPQLVHSLT